MSSTYTPKGEGEPTEIVTVRMPSGVLQSVQGVADAQGKSRSYMIIMACRRVFISGTEDMPQEDHGDPEEQ